VVWDVLDNSLRRSGRPMDALGFYKEICARGGFVNRESAKKRIKMPDVFKVTLFMFVWAIVLTSCFVYSNFTTTT
jgi:hypothetical protein